MKNMIDKHEKVLILWIEKKNSKLTSQKANNK